MNITCQLLQDGTVLATGKGVIVVTEDEYGPQVIRGWKGELRIPRAVHIPLGKDTSLVSRKMSGTVIVVESMVSQNETLLRFFGRGEPIKKPATPRTRSRPAPRRGSTAAKAGRRNRRR